LIRITAPAPVCRSHNHWTKNFLDLAGNLPVRELANATRASVGADIIATLIDG